MINEKRPNTDDEDSLKEKDTPNETEIMHDIAKNEQNQIVLKNSSENNKIEHSIEQEIQGMDSKNNLSDESEKTLIKQEKFDSVIGEFELSDKEKSIIKEIKKLSVENIDSEKLNETIEYNDDESAEIFPPSRIIKVLKMIIIGSDSLKFKESIYNNHPCNLYIETEDGIKIGSYLYRPKTVNENTCFFIICHGKGCERSQMDLTINFIDLAEQKNAVMLMIDYRGFGDSTGEYSIKE